MERAPRIVDLSWPVHPGMPMFPGDPPVEHQPMGQYATHGFVSHRICLPAHSGTHMDAPAHVLPGGASLADMPLSRFRGPGVVLDVRNRPERAVGAGDIAPLLAPLARLLARQAEAAFVLLRTGDEERWGQDGYYTEGSFLTPEAAELLASLSGFAGPEMPGPGLSGLGLSGPGLSGIGLDAGSVDPADSRALPAHHALLGAGLVIVENLRGLGQLVSFAGCDGPEGAPGFIFLCLPVLGCDGSPVRAAALLPPQAADMEGA